MGRKQFQQAKKGSFKGRNAKIGRKNEGRGGKRVNDNFKSTRNSRPQHRGSFQRSRQEQQRQQKPKDKPQQFQIHGKNQKNLKKKNLGQYSQMVGKSIFKIIPQGQDENYKDKFAALNGEQQQQGDEQYYEAEGDDQPNFEEEMENNEQDQEDQEEMEGQQDEIDEQNNEDENEYPDEQEEDEFGGNQDEEQNQYENEVDQDEEIEAKKQGEQQNQEQVPIVDEQEDQNVDISVINLRIQETLQVLMSLPRLGQGKPRKHFIDKLKAYVHRYYGYNYELIDHFLNFLNPAEMIQFFEANETQRPLTIRTNTLKTRRKQLAQALIQRGVNLDPLAQWSKVGIKIYETKVPIGATPQYLAGHYMLQSASSFLPVLALDPQMNEKILDMASAPGGKTTYIAQIMKNTGSIFANDLKKDRLKALQFNVFRLGITNTVVTCRDGRKYPEIFPNTFDRVLLDAPCTGLGIISKDHSIKSNRVLLDIYKNSHVQKQLLLAAIDSTKVGGVIVYSTCSVSPLQNEEVINYALKKRFVKIVDIDDLVEVGDPGIIKFVDKRYHVDLRKTKRIYPHVHNMDGFYLGKLVKLSNGKKQAEKQAEQPTN